MNRPINPRNSPLSEREKANARRLRRDDTWAEKLMWRWLRSRRFAGYKFRRQHPCGRYFLEFCCHKARLVVELDGGHHGFPDQRAHDEVRDDWLAAQGIRVMRFWNSQLRAEGQSIRDAIWQALQERAPHPLPEYCQPMAEAEETLPGQE